MENKNQLILCSCGCGKQLEKYKKYSNGKIYERKYIHGHNPTQHLTQRGEMSPLWRGGKPRYKICGKILGHGKNKDYCREHSAKGKGNNHYNWKGGITSENSKIRKSTQYSEWRNSVFTRDNFTCQKCGATHINLNAHHIQPFFKFPELRMDIDNGITLCNTCHKLAHNWKIKNE